MAGEDDEKGEALRLRASNSCSCRSRARSDEVWSEVYNALPIRRMREIGALLDIHDPRLLVTIRHLLAGLFLDQLRTMAGDPKRAAVRDRRAKLTTIAALAASLQAEYEDAITDIIHDLDEAAWHSPVRWGPSHFRYDYEQLLVGIQAIEWMCEDILNSPAFNPLQNDGYGPTGLPAKLPDRPGSWAKEAFAVRLTRLFVTVTNRAATTSGSQDTIFQKFVGVCFEMFRDGYRELGQPFGPFTIPTRRDLNDARARHK